MQATARGKHRKQATCALAAKLLRRCWAVLQSQRAYVVEHRAAMATSRGFAAGFPYERNRQITHTT